MLGGSNMRIRPRQVLYFFIATLFIVPGCLDFSDTDDPTRTSEDGPITIEVWHTFAAESKEEEAFTNAVRDFEAVNPNITVEITLVPFGNADQLFMTAAQGLSLIHI